MLNLQPHTLLIKFNYYAIMAEDVDVNIYLQIYLNGIKVYDGWANIPCLYILLFR